MELLAQAGRTPTTLAQVPKPRELGEAVASSALQAADVAQANVVKAKEAAVRVSRDKTTVPQDTIEANKPASNAPIAKDHPQADVIPSDTVRKPVTTTVLTLSEQQDHLSLLPLSIDFRLLKHEVTRCPMA